MRKKSAFTLIEMAIVMVVLGLIIGIGIPMFKTLMQQNRLTKARSGVEKAKEEVLAYVKEHYCLPKPDYYNGRRVLPLKDFVIRDITGEPFVYDAEKSLWCKKNKNYSLSVICDNINKLLNGNLSKLFVERNRYKYAFVIVSPGINYRFDKGKCSTYKANNDKYSAYPLSNNSKRYYESPYHKYSEECDDIVGGVSLLELKNELGCWNSTEPMAELLSVVSIFVNDFYNRKNPPKAKDVNLPMSFSYKKKNNKEAIITHYGLKATIKWSKKGIKEVNVK